MFRHSAFGVSFLLAATVSAQMWSPRDDFSIERGNPNGVWSYGWMPVGFGEFTPFTNHALAACGPQWYGWGGDWTPCIWRNELDHAAYDIPVGEIALHPGPGTEPVVLRWTAPMDATPFARVVGYFGPGDGGWMQTAVRVNGVTVWTAPDHGVFDLKVDAAAGDVVDFTVFGGYGFGNTHLHAVITLGCPADFNGDGFVDFFDYQEFVDAFETGVGNADVNGDGFVDFFDYGDFVLAFETGC